MSAASAPRPDDAPEPTSDADGWVLLESMRRRLDDQAALGRTTQAQVAQLAESIAALVAQQRRRSLWLNVNSFVAYLVFTILCGAGSYLLYRSRATELTAARDQAVAARDQAVRHADAAGVRAVARETADNRAWEVYQLLEAGKRDEALTKLEALRDQPLSRTERTVLAARVQQTQATEVDTALKAAAAALAASRARRAGGAGRAAEPPDKLLGHLIKPLEAALVAEPAGPHAAAAHYYLGVAYARTELGKAATHLQAAIDGDVDQHDARFQLASVLDRSGAYALARAEYDRFATAHPQSPLAGFAMRRSATLARFPAAAPARPPGAAPGAPGAPSRPRPTGAEPAAPPRARVRPAPNPAGAAPEASPAAPEATPPEPPASALP
jgi:tetratricopeptide (TPR) repeat protein